AGERVVGYGDDQQFGRDGDLVGGPDGRVRQQILDAGQGGGGDAGNGGDTVTGGDERGPEDHSDASRADDPNVVVPWGGPATAATAIASTNSSRSPAATSNRCTSRSARCSTITVLLSRSSSSRCTSTTSPKCRVRNPGVLRCMSMYSSMAASTTSHQWANRPS